ncbi:MAG: monooxygenase [Blastopirellula sp.]|nr:MAG: monooxygenase [Blastopirellula sp.]
MTNFALFVRHKSKPGQRDKVREVWEQYVKPRAASNADHLAYYFCYDENQADTICVFQMFTDKQAYEDFLAGDWYPEYLDAVSEFVLEAPTLNTANPIWIKG